MCNQIGERSGMGKLAAQCQGVTRRHQLLILHYVRTHQTDHGLAACAVRKNIRLLGGVIIDGLIEGALVWVSTILCVGVPACPAGSALALPASSHQDQQAYCRS